MSEKHTRDWSVVGPELLEALKIVRFNWAGHAEQCAWVQRRARSREERFACDCDWPKIRTQIDAAIAKTIAKATGND